MPFHIALFEPEIPPNTGNIMRLCANTGCSLHLVEPLGFSLDEPRLRRAGLDYREYARVDVHSGWPACHDALGGARVWAFSTRGTTAFGDVAFAAGDALLFGPETRGLPPDLLARFEPAHTVRLPMRPESRSLNLANAVAIVAYEAWRQIGYRGGA